MRIELPSGTPASLAHPSDGEAGAGLVVAPDIFGIRPLFDDLAQRLADEHRLDVIAVEPFPGLDLATVEDRFAAVPRLDDDRVLGDLQAAADLLGQARTGLIGFCMGGMYALKAARLRRFDAIVAFYGMIRVPVPWRGLGHGEPLDAVASVAASPVMAVVGGLDPYTPDDDVRALEAAGVTVVRYPEAEHGFVHDPARPAHRPDDAADAWRRAFAFLEL